MDIASKLPSTHPSDYTAYHHLHLFANYLLSESNLKSKELSIALLENLTRQVMSEINGVYGYYETKWYHLCWCIEQLQLLELSFISKELLPFFNCWKTTKSMSINNNQNSDLETAQTVFLATRTIDWF